MSAYSLSRLTAEDISDCLALARAVHFDTPAWAWEYPLRWAGEGAFCLRNEAGEPVATALAIPYKRDLAYIAMVITHPDLQGRGLGRRLMEHLLAYIAAQGIERVMLDASAMGRPLYEKLGFRPLGRVQRWDLLGRALGLGPVDEAIRPARPTDLEATSALDAAAFGVARPQVWGDFLAASAPLRVWVAQDERGELVGLITRQPLPHAGYRLGGWIHPDAQGARSLLVAALRGLNAASVRLNLYDQSAPETEAVLTSLGFRPAERPTVATRMILGSASPPATSASYRAILWHALG